MASLTDIYLNKIKGDEVYAMIANCSPLLYGSGFNKTTYFEQYFKTKTDLSLLILANDREMWGIPTKKALNEISVETLLGFFDTPAFLNRYEEDIALALRDAKKYYEQWTAKNIESLSFAQKISLMEEVLECVWKGNMAGFFSICFDRELLNEQIALQKIPLTQSQVDDMWESALHPACQSFKELQAGELYRLVQNNAGEDEIAEACQYFYTSYGAVLPLDTVKKNIANEFSHTFNTETLAAQLAQLDADQKQRVSVYTAWVKTLSLEQRLLAVYIQKVMYIRDTRKAFLNRGLTVVWRIAESIAKEVKLPDTCVPFLTIQDLKAGEEFLSSHRDEFLARSQGFACLVDPRTGNIEYAPADVILEKNKVQRFMDGNADVAESAIIKGQIGSPGKIIGTCRVITQLKGYEDIGADEILVAGMTRPEYLPLMKKAAAFVTDEGGITCHAAIVAREMKKPCVIGTKVATQVFKDGDMIEVDADAGIVRRIS